MQETQIYLIDDNAYMRDSLMTLFRSFNYRAMAFPSALSFLELASIPEKSILIVDVRMPEMSGIELQQEVKRRYPHTPLIFISGECSVSDSITGIKHGAIEFLLKPLEAEDLLNAIQQACNHQSKILESLKNESFKEMKLAKLAKREREVAELMVAGFKNPEIAKKLKISIETVKQYRSNVLTKLGFENLAELIAFYRS